MTKELQQKLYDKYPTLFANKDESPKETCLCWGIEANDGWFSLIDKMCQKIMEVDINKEVRFEQVKEKYATLRVYLESYNIEEVEKIIEEAEIESSKTCEFCGKKRGAKLRKEDWLVTLCNKCYRSYFKKDK